MLFTVQLYYIRITQPMEKTLNEFLPVPVYGFLWFSLYLVNTGHMLQPTYYSFKDVMLAYN